jgi:hypothetical protein
MASGRPFRELNIVDDVTRECLAAALNPSISVRRAIRVLAELISRRCKLGKIVSTMAPNLPATRC